MRTYPGKLGHATPGWVHSGAVFHVRIRADRKTPAPLTHPDLSARLLESARRYLHNFSRLNGSTACERYLKSIDRQTEDEVTRLAHDALGGLRYTVISGIEARPDYGLVCQDHFLGQQVFIVDRGLSRMPDGKVALATALYPVNNWFMTTGAALPLPESELDETLCDLFIAAGLKFAPPVKLPVKDISRLVLTVIKAVGATGVLERVRYQ